MKATLANNHIVLSFRGNPAAIKFVRTIAGRSFDPGTRTWKLPLTVNEHTLRNLEKLGFSVDPAIFDAIKSRITRDADLERLEHQPDAALETALPLYPFQRTAAAWMSTAGGGINAYPVGTGKTMMTVATIEQLRAQRVLVVSPKSLLYQWQSEVNKWQPTWNTVVIDGPAAARHNLYFQYRTATTPAVLIVSYDIARRDFNLLKDMPKWDAVICDEAHRLGNVRTKTRKAIKLFESVRRYALTATPLMNHPAELYGIVDWCFPGSMGGYKDFLERFTFRNEWGAVLRAINVPELSRLVRRYMIRKELSELALELPPMTIEDIPFDLSEKERELYDQITAELLFDIERQLINKVENPVMIQNTLVKMVRLLECCDSLELLGADQTSSKLDILKDRLEDVAINGTKIIIFSRFTRMIEILKRELADYSPLVITGQITGQARAEAVRTFGDDPQCRVLLCSEAGGEGLNLEMANVIFHYDLPYSYGKYVQRNGRIARLTQKKPMMVYNLCARKSMDEKIARIIARKQDLAEELLGGGDIRQLL